MCLITNQSKPYIAKTDMVVYKVVTKNPNGRYISPYEKYPYELNKVYEEEDDTIENHTCTIDKGWFHGFHSYIAALLVQPHIKDATIVVGIIPKGTPYYLGMYSDICSKKIKLIKEL